MASTGIIQRRRSKLDLIADPPIEGELVFAMDSLELGMMLEGQVIWRKFEDLVPSVAGRIGHIILSKNDVGLDQADNTSDLNKPVSIAVGNLIDIITADFSAHATSINPHNVTKNQIGLGNADNTSDLNKPVSSAVQHALALKLDVGGTAFNSSRLGGNLSSDFYTKNFLYTKTEIDNIVDTMPSFDDVYRKSEVLSLLAPKASTLYVDQKLATKATINELKIVEAALTSYVDSHLNDMNLSVEGVTQLAYNLQENKADKDYIDNLNFQTLNSVYIADGIYDMGTVVGIGGLNEVTAATTTTPLVGVVVSRNGGAVNVCLKGNCYCKISGVVNKGEKIVVDFNNTGIGRPSTDFNPLYDELIGVALEDSINGVVKILVK